ncbi:MAG: site-specific integrase, partial [Pseudomonadota bacterium]
QFDQINQISQKSGIRTISDIWPLYFTDRAHIRSADTLRHRWKALAPHFGPLPPNAITREHTTAYELHRKNSGRKDWTIWSEIGLVQQILRWAVHQGVIDQASHIERPPAPEPKDLHLTREQFRTFYAALKDPHQKLFVQLAIATAARKEAILQLTWDRVDFERGHIHLRVPGEARRKGRAIVPMTKSLRAALQDARQWSLSDHVIEWAGKPVKDVKNGIRRAAIRCDLPWVSAHVLRHTAAVWLVEADVPMSVVSQYLGHSSISVTEKVYARFSNDYLQSAADVLDHGLEQAIGSIEPKGTDKKLKIVK